MKKIIIANWKMNPETLVDAKKIFNGIKKTASKTKNTQTVVCVPYVFLSELKKLATGKCALGVQDIAGAPGGAHTGLVSAGMVKKYNVTYAVVGHSEARARGQSNEDVHQKILSALTNKIISIVCVGETERDNQGFYWHAIKEQVSVAFANLPRKNLENIIIAYEPVWAVGKGAKREATPAECFEVTVFIKKVLSDLYTPADAHKVTILYGGSVNVKDALGFAEHGGVDGYLVGRESLVVKDFNILQEQLEYYANTEKNKQRN